MNRIVVRPRITQLRPLSASPALNWRPKKGRYNITYWGTMHSVSKDAMDIQNDPKAKYRFFGFYICFFALVAFIYPRYMLKDGQKWNANCSTASDRGPSAWQAILDKNPYETAVTGNRRLADLQAHELVRLERDAKIILEELKMQEEPLTPDVK